MRFHGAVLRSQCGFAVENPLRNRTLNQNPHFVTALSKIFKISNQIKMSLEIIKIVSKLLQIDFFAQNAKIEKILCASPEGKKENLRRRKSKEIVVNESEKEIKIGAQRNFRQKTK